MRYGVEGLASPTCVPGRAPSEPLGTKVGGGGWDRDGGRATSRPLSSAQARSHSKSPGSSPVQHPMGCE
jgi:hypothetical protein